MGVRHGQAVFIFLSNTLLGNDVDRVLVCSRPSDSGDWRKMKSGGKNVEERKK